ncbi:hypothetical protein BDFB_005907 [Asbolus verrucosus]|uniref:Uncharacterized protein n=1 Tax=Asbolus verrucosus TaxID=1661398 RepID=A0A482W983_ASBVE|nr:hypothetical protein BDFB_005907 [Asbolus verrucosus]
MLYRSGLVVVETGFSNRVKTSRFFKGANVPNSFHIFLFELVEHKKKKKKGVIIDIVTFLLNFNNMVDVTTTMAFRFYLS